MSKGLVFLAGTVLSALASFGSVVLFVWITHNIQSFDPTSWFHAGLAATGFFSAIGFFGLVWLTVWLGICAYCELVTDS